MRLLKDINIKDKTVLLRVDYNVPIKDGVILDNNRIKESLETIDYLLENNCKIILMSHLEKVKTLEDKEKYSLYIVKEELEKLLNKDVKFSKDLTGENLINEVNNLQNKEILLLENVRHMDYPDNLESNCDSKLSEFWASLADVFVFDAFGSAHRKHASTYGVREHLNGAVGFLVEKEIKELGKVKKEQKTLLLGGVKIEDKIGVIKNLLPTTNKVIVGGAMCATFLKSLGYEVGKTLVNEEKISEVKELINTGKIILPIDVVTENGIKDISNIEKEESILDMGPKTIELYTKELESENLIILNGTMGKYEEEKYSYGTEKIFEYLKSVNKKVVVLGGDGGSASKKYGYKAYYTSTGGGASLNYLEGKTLSALEIME